MKTTTINAIEENKRCERRKKMEQMYKKEQKGGLKQKDLEDKGSWRTRKRKQGLRR